MDHHLKIDGRSLRRFPSLEDRFWKKVQKNEPDKCWNWTAALNEHGYGVLRTGGKKSGNTLAHRVSFKIHYGKDPEDLFVCHKCDTPNCVNPSHLFLGTAEDNTRDAINKGRLDPDIIPNGVINRNKTHCVNGHEFSIENTRVGTQGKNNTTMRQCKTCAKERMRRYKGYKTIGNANSNKTHCIRGHEFSEENTYQWMQKNGKMMRICRTCQRDNMRILRDLRRGDKTTRKPNHCKNGHELTPENTYETRQKNNKYIMRRCRTCQREKMREITGSGPRTKKTHCKNGHEFTPENTSTVKDGQYIVRACRICQRRSSARYAATLAAKNSS